LHWSIFDASVDETGTVNAESRIAHDVPDGTRNGCWLAY
jgi:hypothetical protein